MLTLSYLEHCTVLPCALCDPPPVILVVKHHPFHESLGFRKVALV